MSRIHAPLAALRRPLPDCVGYWLFSGLGSVMFLAGLLMNDPYIFASGITSMLLTESWMIRRTIVAKRG